MSHVLILAQTAAAAPAPAGSPTDAMVNIIVLVLFVGAMYFLAIAPQQHKEKEHQKLIKEIQKGDEVVTLGGVIGVIEKLGDDRVALRTSDKTIIEFQRAAIVGKTTAPTPQKKA